MKRIGLAIFVVLFAANLKQVQCQGLRTGGNNIVYGDIKAHEGATTGSKPLTLDVLLYTEAGELVFRQTVSSNGRYRFTNLTEGRFQIAVELENSEVARFKIDLSSPLKHEIRQDIEFQLNETKSNTATAVSVADYYNRSEQADKAYRKATESVEKKSYDQAITQFREIVKNDPNDFPAWAELGRLYFIQKDFDPAENAYLEALKRRPDFQLALISLGRLRIVQKKFDGAIEVLTQAVKLQPPSAQANYFLGEAYLQIKKGSIAVGYLNEAIKLDPVGMADAHLRLGALYNAVGMKDKAAAEYEEFLKQRPDDPEKEKLQAYITANKKP
jgi:tetratricopeptide (TPR) repeat protein